MDNRFNNTLVAAFFLTLPAFAKKATLAVATPQPNPSIFGEWRAIGSGCFATFEKAGNVRFIHAPGATPNTFEATFMLPDYKLHHEKGIESKAVAKECAIRLTVNPGKGKKVKFVTGSTELTMSKDKGAAASALVELKIGTQSLAESRFSLKEAETINNRVEKISLLPGKSPELAFPKLDCQMPKIIGVDYSFQSKRGDKNESVTIELTGDRKLNIVVDLEDCKI